MPKCKCDILSNFQTNWLTKCLKIIQKLKFYNMLKTVLYFYRKCWKKCKKKVSNTFWLYLFSQFDLRPLVLKIPLKPLESWANENERENIKQSKQRDNERVHREMNFSWLQKNVSSIDILTLKDGLSKVQSCWLKHFWQPIYQKDCWSY